MKKLRIVPLLLALVLIFSSCAKPVNVEVNAENFNTNYKFVFVHGLSGWGSYDKRNKYLKYWGMYGGDLMKYLNSQGFDCYAASVDPYGSAWDRACELYAQLSGSVVDYGEAHSKHCNHERFGRDFSKEPLIEKWDSENKINLLGHSFGGATVRLLAELMANGSEEEQKATPKEELSPLFTGGKADWIYSVTALAAPHNGTTAYCADDGKDVSGELTFSEKRLSDMVSSFTAGSTDGRDETDYANFDLKIDNAAELNKKISTLENVYYFSVPCCSTSPVDDADYEFPDRSITEKMFVKSALLMGRAKGVTEGGVTYDEKWYPNDGLVNTISAEAPDGAPRAQYTKGKCKTGVWYVMPTYRGDHMSLQGGMMKTNDVREFYAKHLSMINAL